MNSEDFVRLAFIRPRDQPWSQTPWSQTITVLMKYKGYVAKDSGLKNSRWWNDQIWLQSASSFREYVNKRHH